MVRFAAGKTYPDFEWSGIKYTKQVVQNYNWPLVDKFIEDGVTVRPKGIPSELMVQHWFDKNNVTDHPNSKHCFVPRAGKAKFETVLEGDDSKKSYKRLHRWRYSPTAAYGNNEVHLHPYKARRITVAEALAIQSLPAKFELPSDMTLSNMFKTVGNGVPYLAIRGLAESIFKHLGVEYASHNTKSSKSYQSTAA